MRTWNTKLKKHNWFYLQYLRFLLKVKMPIRDWIRISLNKYFGICLAYGCWKRGERRVQNTAYVEEEKNWITLCPNHHVENDEYWQERWDEYYRGVCNANRK